ncbi:hypothetical protein DP44_1582 [Burkholderia pseudomallei]|uniref:hypothetical protein n=1 Tax=Burkholderia pseudomallei TaxID=28450 RepID=UPI00050D9F79|nr:hypothetical protein [Burkholderia pseudomallei]KGD37409.1 hypothetical protein DP44_1582 [Burkholderia pseudomallei]KGS07885.1 hypothetical protein X948_6173 [Burkholderia pseudomallei MSHR5608]KKB65989.1 hypothetical protein BBMA_2340 [Burkholderia pseudomallei MSHR1079]
MKTHEFATMRNRAKPAPVGARALGGECMKTAPSRKTAGEEGDRAKAAAAACWCGRVGPSNAPVQPRHGLAESLAALDPNAGHPANAKPL